MLAFVQAHGGYVAVFTLVIVCYNILMSAIAQIFNTLKKQEPEVLQKAGQLGSTVAGWLSANTPTQPVSPSSQPPASN